MNNTKNRLLKTVIVLLILLDFNHKCFSQISLTDKNRLDIHLTTLSLGWVPESVHESNMIFAKPHYTANDWKLYFEEFFAKNYYSNDLSNYLGYPTFFWLGNEVNSKLQTSLEFVFSKHLDSFYTKMNYFTDELKTKPAFVNDINNKISMIANLTAPAYTKLLPSKLDSIDTFLESLILRTQYLKRNKPFGLVDEPYVARIATGVHAIWIRMKPLTQSRIETIINTIQLQPAYASLMRRFNLFVADNNGMSSRDLNFLDTLLSKVPQQIHKLWLMTHSGYLLSPNQLQLYTSFNIEAVNVFSTVGGYRENSFPEDVSQYLVDGFCLVAAHELTHRLDPDYIDIDPVLLNRKRQLVRQAGKNKMNYLRSMLPDGFFETNPQEFIASISNQYIANTDLTLTVALKRFDNGLKEPLNQFNYFADLFSAKSNQTVFYQNNTNAELKSWKVDVKRNSKQQIIGFIRDSIRYKFNLTDSGNVLSYKKVAIGITGQNSQCVGDNKSFSVKAGKGLWKTSNQSIATIDQNGKLNAITKGDVIISFIDTTSGSFDTLNLAVQINNTPSKPEIMKTVDNYLTSNKTTGHIWYNSEIQIVDTSAKFRPDANGYYRLAINENGCISQLSDSYYFLTTAVFSETNYNGSSITCEISENKITIRRKFNSPKNTVIKLYDINGRIVKSICNNNNENIIYINEINSGFYILNIWDQISNKTINKKILVQ